MEWVLRQEEGLMGGEHYILIFPVISRGNAGGAPEMHMWQERGFRRHCAKRGMQ
jgi:hypothetical protein